MRKLFVVLLFIATFCSCKSVAPPLYSWGQYEDCYYDYYKKLTPKSLATLYYQYAYLVDHPGGSRATVPPGMYAEYGYMLINPETPSLLIQYHSNPENFPKSAREHITETDWNKTFNPVEMRAKGLKMLQKEIELYPESATFLTPIINKISQQ